MATNPLEAAARGSYTLPEWARQSGRAVDLRNSPFWAAQEQGSGSGSLGGGDGSGFYSPLNRFAAQQVGNGEGQYSAPADIQGATDFLGSSGQQMMEAYGGNNEVARWLQDAEGNITGAPEVQSLNDDNFGYAAMLAAAVTGANLYGAYGGAGAASGQTGGMTAEQVAQLSANGLTDAQIAQMATAAGDTAMASSLTGAGMGGEGGFLSTLPSAAAPKVGGGSIVDAAKVAGGAMDWSDWAKIGATLIGSGIQSNAASNAVDAQARSTDAAIAEQRRQFDLQRSDSAAYRDAGTNALSQFQALANTPTTAADVMQDPGYQFGLDQGQQAIDRKVAAMGGRVSGAAIKAAGRFGTNYATTGFTAADQRRNDRLNRLAALAGIGQSATNASAAAGSAMANNIGGLVTGQGNAAGGGILAQGNIWGNTANQLAALYGRGSQQTGNRPPTSPFANYGGDYNSLDYRP